jgi:hypothetical protein
MAGKTAKQKKAVSKSKPDDKAKPTTMREKIAQLKLSREETKQGGKFVDQKSGASARKGVAQTGMLRRGKQR